MTNAKLIPSKSVNNFISGSLAGATAVVLTYPLDLVRVKLAVDIVENQFRGVAHCIKTVHQEQGIRGLYKGMSPTLLVCFFFVKDLND